MTRRGAHPDRFAPRARRPGRGRIIPTPAARGDSKAGNISGRAGRPKSRNPIRAQYEAAR